MPCEKVCEKLWANYLHKYGDYRERLQAIRNDQQCFMQFQLPRIRQQSINVHVQSSGSIRKPAVADSNRKLSKKCDPLLPVECSPSSLMKNHRSFARNESDLEKLIEAENFPDNIFPVNTESRPSLANETQLSVADTLPRLTAPLNSIFGKNNVSHSITPNNPGSSIQRTIQESEFPTDSHDPITSRITNPYRQLLERLRQAEKPKLKHSSTISEIPPRQTSFQIDANTHHRIEKLLSFLQSLDAPTDTTEKSNIFDENTLIALFSMENHLSSSIYIPTSIQELDIIPKTILQSLRNTSDNKQIFYQIQTEMSRDKLKESNSNIHKDQMYSNNDSPTTNSIDQNNELNSRLCNTYTIKAFKDFLIHRNKSARLPKLFHDLDRFYSK